MKVESNENEILIKFEKNISVEEADKIIDYINYLKATSGSKATQADVDKLAEEVNQEWYKKNKDSFLK